MSNVAFVIGTLVFLFSVFHTIIFRGNFQHNLYLYFFLGFIVVILVISGVISEAHFENFPALVAGVKSIFVG